MNTATTDLNNVSPGGCIRVSAKRTEAPAFVGDLVRLLDVSDEGTCLIGIVEEVAEGHVILRARSMSA